MNNIDLLSEFKRISRSIKLSYIDDKKIFTYDRSSIFPSKFNIFKKKTRKRINIINKAGGVLTGSRVLEKTYLNLKGVIDRSVWRTSDYDFLITQDMLFEISNEVKITNDENRFFSVINWGEYGLAYSLKMELIIVNSLPNYDIVHGIRYADPLSILLQKLRYVEDGEMHRSDIRKHQKDLDYFSLKFGKDF